MPINAMGGWEKVSSLKILNWMNPPCFEPCFGELKSILFNITFYTPNTTWAWLLHPISTFVFYQPATNQLQEILFE